MKRTVIGRSSAYLKVSFFGKFFVRSHAPLIIGKSGVRRVNKVAAKALSVRKIVLGQVSYVIT